MGRNFRSLQPVTQLLAKAKKHEEIHLEAFSKALIEDGVFGYDILAYAVQGAAATLLLSAPSTVLDRSNLGGFSRRLQHLP